MQTSEIKPQVVTGTVVGAPPVVVTGTVVSQPPVVTSAPMQVKGTPVLAPPGPPQEWGSSWTGCLGDPLGCLIYCCFPDCGVCCDGCLADKLGLEASQKGCGNWCIMLLSNMSIYGFPILCNAFCDCPCGKKWVSPCWYTAVLDAAVRRHNLKYPGPCGDASCMEGCKYQMCCCVPCTLCLIRRELNAREGAAGAVTKQPGSTM